MDVTRVCRSLFLVLAGTWLICSRAPADGPAPSIPDLAFSWYGVYCSPQQLETAGWLPKDRFLTMWKVRLVIDDGEVIYLVGPGEAAVAGNAASRSAPGMRRIATEEDLVGVVSLRSPGDALSFARFLSSPFGAGAAWPVLWHEVVPASEARGLLCGRAPDATDDYAEGVLAADGAFGIISDAAWRVSGLALPSVRGCPEGYVVTRCMFHPDYMKRPATEAPGASDPPVVFDVEQLYALDGRLVSEVAKPRPMARPIDAQLRCGLTRRAGS